MKCRISPQIAPTTLSFGCFSNICLDESDILIKSDCGFRKTPKSSFPKHFVSHILYQIQQVGFPNIMKVVNGEIYDTSLHHELYNAINQNLPATHFIEKLQFALNKIRRKNQTEK